MDFAEAQKEALGCARCGLCHSRTQVVFGEGPLNAALFFFIFTFIYALIERSRDRRTAQASKQKKPGKPSQNGGDSEDDSPLKGRPNPNTSRKKSRRRR